MVLLVDIGNSRIKWSDEERLQKGDVSVNDGTDLQNMLEFEWGQIPRPDAVWVSSVVSDRLVSRLSDWTWDAWKLTPSRAKTRSRQLGVVNGYDRPEQLGIDRWLTLIGARDRFDQPLVIVDCGTATTIDALQQDGLHLGGLILPGLQMMRTSLLGNTAIPETGTSSEISCLARDTAAGIDSARVLSTTCLIERVADSFQERIAQEVACVLTGGSAEEIKGTLRMNTYHEPNLVLQGLALVAGVSGS